MVFVGNWGEKNPCKEHALLGAMADVVLETKRTATKPRSAQRKRINSIKS